MTRTERIDKILQQTIEGDNLDVLLTGLTAEDQNLFYDLVAQLRAGGDLELEDLWKIDYSRRPPSMEEFVDDPYWLGDITKHTDDNQGIFKKWKEIVCQDFNLDSRLHNVVITGSLGCGKCYQRGTSILMYDGTTRAVENVKIGEQVMGDDSTPRTVLSTTTGRAKMYRVESSSRIEKFEPFVVNGDHILVTKNTHSGAINEISVDDYLKGEVRKRAEHKLFKVPVDMPKQEVTIDPYWLGLWLGDGNAYEASLCINVKKDPEILAYHRAYAQKLGLECHEQASQRKDNCAVYNLCNTSKCTNHLVQAMIFEGLLSYRDDTDTRVYVKKFIPQKYLRNDTNTRKQVLAGIIDTDGSLGDNGCYDVITSSKELCDGIMYLARSVGYSARYTYKKCSIKSTGFTGYYHRVGITNAYDIPTRVKRKRSTKRKQIKDPLRFGFNVVPRGEGDYYGFSTDGNHRYLLGNFVVSHNSWNSALIMLYRVVLCRLLRNPYGFLGLSKGSPVVFALLSVTRSAVQDTIFGDAMNFMAHSPFFTEECKFDIEKKYAAMKIPLGNNIVLTAGSQGQHVLGRNTLGVAMDEGNWRREANPDEKAYKLYDDIRQRITNRFQKVAGFLPAICILASSARDESSFTEQVITDINKTADPKTQRVYRLAAFEVKRDQLTLKPRWFKVAFGLKTVSPRILKGWYREDGTVLEAGDEIPPGARTRLVPEDYLPDFKRNVITSLQSICGESTGGAFKLFGDFSIVEMAVQAGEKAGLSNPCQIDQVPLSNDDSKEMWDFLDHKKFVQRQLGRYLPLRDPGMPRYAHYDLATVNQAGLAITHVAGRKLVDGLYDAASGKVFSQYRPIIEYDFILAIVPGEQKEISLIKIQNFIFWLRDRCGFQFGVVTADSFQSQMPLELLSSHGFEVDILSLDRTKEPYYSWRAGFSEQLIRTFRHGIMMHEAENLQDLAKKIEHPNPGTKDVADACAGAYFNALRLGLGSIGTDGAVADLWTERSGTEVKPPITMTVPAETAPVHSFEG